MKYRIASLIVGFIAVSSSCMGQVRYEPTDPFSAYSIGVGVGYTTIYGALKKSDPEPVYLLDFTRHITSAIVVGIEVQHGTIMSTEPPNDWTTGLSETNEFTAANLNGRVTIGQFLFKYPQNNFYKVLSGIYVGTGVGIIDNDITSITDKFKTTDTKTINSDIIRSGTSATIPGNIGLNIYMKEFLGLHGTLLNINYQQNYSFNDDVNGYSFPATTTTHKYNAIYSVLSVGLSFYLGHREW